MIRALSAFPARLVVPIVLALLVLGTSPVWGQSTGSPGGGEQGAPGQMGEQEMMEKMMALATPGEHHKELGRLVGTWKTTNKMWMGQEEPMITSGSSSYEWVLGGRYLKSRHIGQFADMPFEGMGIDGYDNAKQEYFSLWFDNMGTGVMNLKGRVTPDGKGLDYSGISFDPMQMRDVGVREEVRWLSNTKYTFTMYMEMPGPDGKPQEMRVMEITAEKQ